MIPPTPSAVAQEAESRAAYLIARARGEVGRPGECFCTGDCRPDPANCPARIYEALPLAEKLEQAAALQDIFGHHDVAKLIRAAVA